MKEKDMVSEKPKQKISKYSYLMLLGHATTDITQGSLPALLPFLIAERHYTYAAAAGLVFAGNLLSAVTQPIFGWLGDRTSRPWFMIIGILLAAVGIALIGFLDNYIACCGAVVVMGIGVSLFHPEGSKLANIAAGSANKGAGMSIFSVGGNIGFTGGPIIATAAIYFFGLKGTVVFLIPAAVTSILLAPHMKGFARLGMEFKEQVRQDTKSGELPPDNIKGFSAVAIVTFFRAIVNNSLNTFIPLFWIGVFMTSATVGNFHLSIFAASGIVATLIGGRLADVVGFRVIYRTCCVVAAPLLFLFVLNRSPIIGAVLLILISIFLSTCNSALVVTGQGFMPNRIGTASGVLFGLTISMGGLVAPFIGRLGDVYGIETAMFTIACFSVGALVTVFFIPKAETDKPSRLRARPESCETGGDL